MENFKNFCFEFHQCLTISENFPLSIHADDKHKFYFILEENFLQEKFSKLKSLSIGNIDIRT